MRFTETMTPSRRLMDHLYGDDAPALRRDLRRLAPTNSADPADQLIDAMAEAEFASHMEDLARRASETAKSPERIFETAARTPLQEWRAAASGGGMSDAPEMASPPADAPTPMARVAMDVVTLPPPMGGELMPKYDGRATAYVLACQEAGGRIPS